MSYSLSLRQGLSTPTRHPSTSDYVVPVKFMDGGEIIRDRRRFELLDSLKTHASIFLSEEYLEILFPAVYTERNIRRAVSFLIEKKAVVSKLPVFTLVLAASYITSDLYPFQQTKSVLVFLTEILANKKNMPPNVPGLVIPLVSVNAQNVEKEYAAFMEAMQLSFTKESVYSAISKVSKTSKSPIISKITSNIVQKQSNTPSSIIFTPPRTRRPAVTAQSRNHNEEIESLLSKIQSPGSISIELLNQLRILTENNPRLNRENTRFLFDVCLRAMRSGGTEESTEGLALMMKLNLSTEAALMVDLYRSAANESSEVIGYVQQGYQHLLKTRKYELAGIEDLPESLHGFILSEVHPEIEFAFAMLYKWDTAYEGAIKIYRLLKSRQITDFESRILDLPFDKKTYLLKCLKSKLSEEPDPHIESLITPQKMQSPRNLRNSVQQLDQRLEVILSPRNKKYI